MALKQGTECAICDSQEFTLSNGLFFCSECGTQSQDVREEITADDDAMLYVRTLKATSKKKAKNVASTTTDVTQLERFQTVLQLQCDTLIKLGFDSSLKEAVKLVWFQYLKHCGYAFIDSQESTSTGDQKQNHKLSSDKTSGPTSNVCKPKSKRKKPVKRSKRKESSNLSTLTPLVTNSTRKRSHQSEDEAKHKKTKRSRKEPASPSQNIVIRFNLSDSSDDETVKDKPNTSASLPDDSHLFNSSSDDNPNESDTPHITDDNPVGSKFGMELYEALKGKWSKHEYFTIKYTICFCYLGLLYTHQNILMADLSRWIYLHKLPYHNLASILPRSFLFGCNCKTLVGVKPVPPDTIFKTTRLLYAFLPLPPLPSRDPRPLCHTLIDRLHLPAYFHRMMDKILNCIHEPQLENALVMNKGRCNYYHCRFDAECLAIIAMLLRLIYTLDDCHEFEMVRLVEGDVQSESSQEKHPVNGELTDKFVYFWEDWVALYSREKLDSLQSGIPMNARELKHVTNVTNYLDFCRVEVLEKSRLSPISSIKNPVYRPEYFAMIADIFKKHRHKTTDKKATDNCLGESSPSPERQKHELGKLETSFQPRRIPIQALLADPWSVWNQYEELQPSPKIYNMFGVELSHSMRYLLDVCVELIDIHIVDMYDSLLKMELSLIENTLYTIHHIDTFMLKDSYMKKITS